MKCPENADLWDYWKAHPAKLSTRAIRVLAWARIESVEHLREVGPQYASYWPYCGARTMDELSTVAGWPPKPTEQDRRLQAMAKHLRAAGWTVTPPV